MSKHTLQAFVAYEFARKEGFTLSEADLVHFEFTSVGNHHLQHVGFVKNVDGDFVTTNSNGDRLLTYRSQQKKVNKAEVLRRLAVKIEVKEEEMGRKLKKGEKDALTQAIIEAIIPETFPDAPKDAILMLTRVSETDVLIVGGGSWKAAEDMTALLRKASGSLPIVPMDCNILPDELMTEMVDKRKDKVLHKYTLGEKIAMVDGNGYDIKLGKGSVYDAPVEAHLEEGATVTQLELIYDGIISFTMTDKFEFKSVKVSNDLAEFNQAEDDEVQLDAEATTLIVMDNIKKMLAATVELMEGIQSEGE